MHVKPSEILGFIQPINAPAIRWRTTRLGLKAHDGQNFFGVTLSFTGACSTNSFSRNIKESIVEELMKKSLVISEQDCIAAMLENDRVVEFFVNRGELLLEIYIPRPLKIFCRALTQPL